MRILLRRIDGITLVIKVRLLFGITSDHSRCGSSLERNVLMKTRTGILALIFVCAFWLTIAALAMTASAQTPDGETPAEETICDFLQNHTKGLYGLCVAYCEAHDAHLLSPGGDPAELTIPNQRILDNYRKKMKDGDPDMPCVQTTPCPCWNAEQLDALPAPLLADADDNNRNACWLNNPSPEIEYNILENVNRNEFHQVVSYYQLSVAKNNGTHFCTVNHDRSRFYTEIISPGGYLLTEEEFGVCKSLFLARAQKDLVSGERWDCWGTN